MRGTDKYLMVFAGGIVALIIVALVVATMQPDRTYVDDDGPESVVHNYLIALEEGDYERAYTYLSPDLEGYPPNVRAFITDIHNNQWQFPTEENPTALTLLSVDEGDGWADATVRMTVNYGGGLFGLNRNSDEFHLQLEQHDQDWKIAGGERLFVYCWSDANCR